ncbi:response regulator [Aequorivita todarodis]|uniref:LytR/AlgR family response regulator transcription factor n=1 Tax=Aequorivita todarodis TaxID=2036821 RepID=UPI0023504CD8|nr:response regulator [Aequorivita todarodis]MDC7999763.1 response regulator [Aequorivita todarodis]
MKKAILIDDEPNSLDILEYEINQVNKNIEVIAKCSDARKAVQLIEEKQPDILFLDIEMPWFSGFEILDQLSKINFQIIFVTAYDQYAIRAFKYYAFDYLLKPISKKSLIETLDRISERPEKFAELELRNILKLLKKGALEDDKIAVPTLEGFEFYSLENIIRCQADSNYTKIFVTGGKTILVSKTLKNIEERISSSHFFRIHQSHLINLKHIVSYSKADGGDVKMSDNYSVPISRLKRNEFLEKMNLDFS